MSECISYVAYAFRGRKHRHVLCCLPMPAPPLLPSMGMKGAGEV